MFLFCLAMMECSFARFDVWVQMMHDDPFCALISGFAPEDVPGVGTFYDFQDRVLQRLPQPRTTLPQFALPTAFTDRLSERSHRNKKPKAKSLQPKEAFGSY